MEIHYSKQSIKFLAKWDSIEEELPDEIDLQMIREAQADPDCTAWASDAEVQAVLG